MEGRGVGARTRGGRAVTTWLAIAAVGLAALSLVLFVLAIRRLLVRQAEVTVTMLRRYDERLATFAQTLNDALVAFQSPARSARSTSPTTPSRWCAPSSSHGSEPPPTVRSRSSPAGTARRSSRRSACPSPRRTTSPAWASRTTGARARSRSRSPATSSHPRAMAPVRSGLVLPLLGDDAPHSLLGVLTRDRSRRFSEEDVDALDGLVGAHGRRSRGR